MIDTKISIPELLDSSIDHLKLVINEVFGPTFQGEGPSIGRPCAFIRVGGCNLNCGADGGWKCDTSYTWDWSGQNGKAYDPKAEMHDMTIFDLAMTVDALDVDMVVISGGEPLAQQHLHNGRGLAGLLARLKLEPVGQDRYQVKRWIEVETNGTQIPTEPVIALVDQFNVSPKLANSGVRAHMRYKPEAIDALQATGKAVWKFVAKGSIDLAEVATLVNTHRLDRVYISPEGTDPATIMANMARLAPEVLKRKWQLSTRLHILIWGNRRGV